MKVAEKTSRASKSLPLDFQAELAFLAKDNSEQAGAVLKAVGICAKGSLTVTARGILKRLSQSAPDEREKLVRDFLLTEQVMLYSREPGFQFSKLPQKDQQAVLEVLKLFGDTPIFRGLPYEEVAGDAANSARTHLLSSQ